MYLEIRTLCLYLYSILYLYCTVFAHTWWMYLDGQGCQ